MKIRYLIAGLLLLATLTGCLPEKGDNGRLPVPPGAAKYEVKVTTYQLDNAGKKNTWPRRVTVKVNVVTPSGDHGRFDFVNSYGELKQGSYPYEGPEQTPWSHEFNVGGGDDPNRIVTGDVEVTVREMGYRTGVSCTVIRNGVQIATDTEENHTENLLELNVRCVIG